MKFRTEIEPTKAPFAIDSSDRIILAGSCFSDNIGQRLVTDGFNAIYNPLGPLYNPISLAQFIDRLVGAYRYTPSDLTAGPRGFHCLDYASRYSGEDADAVADAVNTDMASAGTIGDDVLIVTFGSAFVFLLDGKQPVGNCHKFPAQRFLRRRLSVGEITAQWTALLKKLPQTLRVIFTVSPIRHLADGLHGNQLSKATLLLAVDQIIANASQQCVYFPAYEMLMDDLRDYRFYAPDMKHPSPTAADYIYDQFSSTFFSAATRARAAECRKATAAAAHRQIL